MRGLLLPFIKVSICWVNNLQETISCREAREGGSNDLLNVRDNINQLAGVGTPIRRGLGGISPKNGRFIHQPIGVEWW